MAEDSDVKIFQSCRMIGILTTAALFAEQMCKTTRIHQFDIQDVILIHHPLATYVFSFTFPFSHRP